MHQSSFDKMTKFRKVFLADKKQEKLTILDLGSQYIGSGKSYRDIFDCPPWVYQGIDMVAGKNVDIVLEDPYKWTQIESESVDVIVSGQALEHVEFFWLTFQEIVRVLKPGGLCCIIVPSSGPEHRYPVDCWRFYPDGFRALARYSNLDLMHVDTQWGECGYTDTSDDWHDTIMVARKPLSAIKNTNSDQFPVFDSESMLMQAEDLNLEPEDPIENGDPNYYHYVRHDMVSLVPEDAQCILDVGCAAGITGKLLKEKKDVFVAGIELNPEAAQEASKILDDVVQDNVETMDVPYKEGSFDCILFADILEHLNDPLSVLKKFKNYVKAEGTIIASIPNVQYHDVLYQLVEGNWTYQDSGILDRTHLRFFTLSEIKKMYEDAGLEICSISANVDSNYEKFQNSKQTKLKVGKLEISDLTPEELQQFFIMQYKIIARPKIPVEAKNLSEDLNLSKSRIEKIGKERNGNVVQPDRGHKFSSAPDFSASDNPLVSIVIPAYNGERFIADCLRSVLCQTYPNLEIIVCDDASTDGTKEAVSHFRDDRIQWHPSEINLGQAKNLNRGIQLARGEYICWVNQDDLFHEDKVRQQLQVFRSKPELGAVFTNRRDVDLDLKDVNIDYPLGFFAVSGDRVEALKLLLLAGCFLYAPSVMCRRDVFGNIGLFNESFKICFDYEMWLRIAHEYPIHNMEAPLLVYRHHSENTSEKPENGKIMDKEMCKVFLWEIEKLKIDDFFHGTEPELRTAKESSESGAAFWMSMARFCLDKGYYIFPKMIYSEGFMKKALELAPYLKQNEKNPLPISSEMVGAMNA